MGDAGDNNLVPNYNCTRMSYSNHDSNYASLSASSSSSLSSFGASTTIDSSNIGFQLLKKHGWREGTGLGASQQGRLEPIETYIKKNKKGLGAEKVKKTTLQSAVAATSGDKRKIEKMSQKAKALSKRMRKMVEEEKQWQEKESERAFFREFWPDNV